jgi:hypothetical protein
VSLRNTHIAELSAVCAGLPRPTQRAAVPGAYSMADIGLSAFSLFFTGSPLFLADQRTLAGSQGRSKCKTLSAIASDNYICLMLDGALTAAFDGLFIKAIETLEVLIPSKGLGGRTLIALDGIEHHCSRKGYCARCSTRKRSDGGTEYFHALIQWHLRSLPTRQANERNQLPRLHRTVRGADVAAWRDPSDG